MNGSDPAESRARLWEHLQECDRCDRDLPCLEWDVLFEASEESDEAIPRSRSAVSSAIAPAGADASRPGFGVVWMGSILVLVGGWVLFAPWILTPGGTRYSVEFVQGVCGSTLGQFAQLVGGQTQASCSEVAAAYFGSWGALIVGAILGTVGLIRRLS